MTDITITKTVNRSRQCMICDIMVSEVYYDLHIQYSRGGFSRTKFKELCPSCFDGLNHSMRRVPE